MLEYYGEDPQKSPNYGRIVNQRHFLRVSKLIQADKVAFGGRTDESDLYIEPTVMNAVTFDDPVMQEEIFGPLLPIVHVNSLDDAIQTVNSHPKPLALYVFSNNIPAAENVLDRTSSGGACVNDCIMHISCPSLPFGGVGNSGFGAYHGRFSFDTFSHHRGTMVKKLGLEAVNSIRYPPYSEKKLSWLKTLMSPKEGNGVVGQIASKIQHFLVPILLAYIVYLTFTK